MGIPEEVKEALNGKDLRACAIVLKYKNWKGRTDIRNVIPLSIFHGSTEYYKDEQWLVKVWDLDKMDYRTYALKSIIEWVKV